MKKVPVRYKDFVMDPHDPLERTIELTVKGGRDKGPASVELGEGITWELSNPNNFYMTMEFVVSTH